MDKEIRKVDDVRDDITKIDYEIAELFEKRMGFAAELALSKKQAGESIYNKNKEEIEKNKYILMLDMNLEELEKYKEDKVVKEYMEKNPDAFDPKKYNSAGREEVKQYVMSKIKVCGSVDKA